MKHTRPVWRILLAVLLAVCTLQVAAGADWMDGILNVDDILGPAISKPTGDMAVRTPSQPMEMLTSTDVDILNARMSEYNGQQEVLLKNRAKTYYYYNNLEPVAKEIYDVMLGVAEDPVSEGNIGLMMTMLDPQSDEYYFAFNVAYRALCFDHPELFWLYSGQEASMCYASEAVSQNGLYFVYIMMTEPFENYEAQMTAFNRAADEFLADIDTNASEYNIVKQIHDKLIAMVDYDNPVADHMVLSLGPGQDLAHSAYGALVKDSSSNPHMAVCDGYSLAFEYLLQQCGIDALFIGGMAGPDETDVGGHAWNLVKVDGVWYEVDSTWDDWGNVENDVKDNPSRYAGLLEALHDPVYREQIDHYLFMISTEQMRHFVPGDNYEYVTKDQTMVYQLAQESVHIRLTEDSDPMNPDPQVIGLAPVAMQNYPWAG